MRTQRHLAMGVAAFLLAVAVGCQDEAGDGRTIYDSVSDGPHLVDLTKVDVAEVVEPVGTSTRECEPQPTAEMPEVGAPVVPNVDSVYVVELERWSIPSDGTDPDATMDGINNALAWAVENGFGTVVLPAGDYLVGRQTSDIYSAAIVLPSHVVFELDPDAAIQMFDASTWNYCVLDINGQTDVVIRGGRVVGDRNGHIHTDGGAHDEGHTVCIWGQSERVVIEETELTGATGDGVLIVGGGDAGSSSVDITIRNNAIHGNRRQGVSIVGGRRVLVENNEIHHIEGTSPQFGVDIESLSYLSRDIAIRGNSFHHNRGGDYVNTDGANVFFEDNTCDQTGLDGPQTDGPIVYWSKTDQVIRGNTITVTTGSSNGRWGIIAYGNNRENPVANRIEGNTLVGGGIHVARMNLTTVASNVLQDGLILGYQATCLRLFDNVIEREANENYKLREVSGLARNNRLNGARYDLPMSFDTVFTNSPPHLW